MRPTYARCNPLLFESARLCNVHIIFTKSADRAALHAEHPNADTRQHVGGDWQRGVKKCILDKEPTQLWLDAGR